jgi:mycothiol synthase
VNLAEFATLVRAQDGVDAFNEESRLAFAEARPGRVNVVVADGDRVVAAAFAPESAHDDAPVELAVHPTHRRRGHATALLDRLLSSGERRFWAHGDLDGSRALAAAAGLVPDRTLLQLRWAVGAVDPIALPVDLTVRAFRPEDLPALLAVNGRAFADHPEQGSLDVAGFERRAASDWFDPSGLLVAERDGTIVGFHWTKVEGTSGEIYVLGVDPSVQGHGIARVLLAAGLGHLIERGVATVDLYVDGDNHAALALYANSGFTEAARDVLYVSRTPAAADRAPA